MSHCKKNDGVKVRNENGFDGVWLYAAGRTGCGSERAQIVHNRHSVRHSQARARTPRLVLEFASVPHLESGYDECTDV